jgi:two-component system cell cycle sensor histidine kinase/response regulator CckA
LAKIKPPLIIIYTFLVLALAATIEWNKPGAFFVVSTFGLAGLIVIIAIKLHFGKIDLTSEQSAHSQKLQSLGELSSAIAYDFNNLLTVIIGNSDLLLNRHPHSDSSFKEAYQIKSNALRGAKLVKQLLSFARKSSIQPININIAELFTELNPLFSQLLSEKYKIVVTNIDKDAMIFADPIQLEQVLINLVINARDAMPNGGNIFIQITFAFINNKNDTEGYYKPNTSKSIEPGQYVRIEVSDSGVGIPKEILPKIFDPFFSTKDSAGTGLGLATVFQIIEKLGGHVLVKSQKNIGTSFLIYISPVKGADINAISHSSPDEFFELNYPDFNILLVEDEDSVRMFGAHALRDFGFNVMDVRTAEEALETIAQNSKKIDLLITDITLGSMDGYSLARLVKQELPDLKIVITSGYDQSTVANIEIENSLFLSKPYTLKELVTIAIRALKD